MSKKRGAQPGADNHRWTGGPYQRKDGYIEILRPDHPRSDQKGHILKHIVLAENALGHFLPAQAVIHHHTPQQLVVCQDLAYHNLLHQRSRALEACGHASWRKCVHCKKYCPITLLRYHGGGSYIHGDCRKERCRLYRLKRKGVA